MQILRPYEALSHFLTLVRVSAGISKPISQMRQLRPETLWMVYVKIMHLIQGRGRTWTQVSVNTGCFPKTCPPPPIRESHSHKHAAPHSLCLCQDKNGFKSHYYSLDTLFWANYINSLYFNSLLYNGTVSRTYCMKFYENQCLLDTKHWEPSDNRYFILLLLLPCYMTKYSRIFFIYVV